MKKYQYNFSDKISSVLDPNIRIKKARKTVAIIKDFLKKDNKSLEDTVCLDIGGSAGYVAKELTSENIYRCYVVDIDEKALQFGKENNSDKKIIYQKGDALNLPFPDNTFDIVICNQVYEHVPSPEKMVKEIFRVLKFGGICYFGAGTKYVIKERHYNLYFLSWLPKRIADKYVKLMHKGNEFYETLYSFRQLKNLLLDFKIFDYTRNILNEPDKFYASDDVFKFKFINKLISKFYFILKYISPGVIFILKKERI